MYAYIQLVVGGLELVLILVDAHACTISPPAYCKNETQLHANIWVLEKQVCIIGAPDGFSLRAKSTMFYSKHIHTCKHTCREMYIYIEVHNCEYRM